MIHKMNELMLQQTELPIGEIVSSALDWDNALYFFISDPDPRRELGLFLHTGGPTRHRVRRALRRPRLPEARHRAHTVPLLRPR